MWHSSYDRDECHEWVRGEFANLAREMGSVALRVSAGIGVLGAALLLSAPARAADPAELESKLTVTIDGVEKTLSLEEAKQALHIPSVSLALIDQDSIAFARAYGENATPKTLYQAASLSKFVAAVGAMRLVEQKKLALDEDVNAKLTSWKVPTNGFDKDHPVTLRGLLSMTAGIGVPGFLGYAVGRAIAQPHADPLRRAAGQLAAGHGDCRARQRLCTIPAGATRSPRR